MCKCKEDLITFLEEKQRMYACTDNNAASNECKCQNACKLSVINEVLDFVRNGSRTKYSQDAATGGNAVDFS